MSKRKTWLLIKRGLSEDPKHREAMGKRVWLFMHIIDRADWETGVVSDWRDKDEAQDMGLNWRTLQQQRQELDDLGYISCAPDGNGQKITVYNWINPKNYAGEVVNPKGEGYVNLSRGGTVTSTSVLRTPSIESQISNAADADNLLPPRKYGPPQKVTPRSREEHRTMTANAISVGAETNASLTSAIETAFHILPNWDTKTNRAAVSRLKNIGATADQVPTVKAAWDKSNGKSGWVPQPSQIVEFWPSAFAAQSAPAFTGKVYE